MTGFQASCEFFRSSVDRPEIKLIVKIIQPRTTKRFTSLFFVLPAAMTDGLPTPERIPKTVIFIDSRRDIQKCAECLRGWLQKLSAGVIKDHDCRQIIQVYHSHTTVNDKNAIYEEFSKANSKIRIMVATESMGTGVDLSDVKRVVQYGFPLDRLLSVLIQRFGRAARMAGIKGEAIFLVESWAIGDKITSTRSAMLPNNQTPSAFRRPSGMSRLARSDSAEVNPPREETKCFRAFKSRCKEKVQKLLLKASSGKNMISETVHASKIRTRVVIVQPYSMR
jgi:superfamily II DNA/RNA helicase